MPRFFLNIVQLKRNTSMSRHTAGCCCRKRSNAKISTLATAFAFFPTLSELFPCFPTILERLCSSRLRSAAGHAWPPLAQGIGLFQPWLGSTSGKMDQLHGTLERPPELEAWIVETTIYSRFSPRNPEP